MTIKWGIIGPGAIAHNFADGLAQTTVGRLVAVAGRDADRRNTFAENYAIPAEKRYSSPAELLSDESIDAVYIATPHLWHAELSIIALRAGKHVLCEKPAGMSAAEVNAVTEVAAQEKRFFMEAMMYRCHPQIARTLEIISSGEIGTPVHIRAQLGFNAPFDPRSRLYDPALAGGAILDVGVYPVSLARLIAGAAEGKAFADPIKVQGTGLLAESGVDAVAYGLLTFNSDFIAEVGVGIARNMDNRAIITGSKGQIILDDPWVPGRNAGPSDSTLHIVTEGATRTEAIRDARMLFAFEAEAVSLAISEGALEARYPAPSHGDSIGNAAVLDQWLGDLSYVTVAQNPGTNRPLRGTIPGKLSRIPKLEVQGLTRPMSQLMICCNTKSSFADGAVLWDAWMEAGGNAFDTGFIFGDGQYERVLGAWIAARRVEEEIVVQVKGAHTPHCNPKDMLSQFDTSLERLGLTQVSLYSLHRDNPEVPVGEFIDALNQLRSSGRIAAFGASNWAPERIIEANDYAHRRGLEPFRILKNNLSLAEMQSPVWPGNKSSNTTEALELLRGASLTHLSWSPDALGYFTPSHLRKELAGWPTSEEKFGGERNAKRRLRAGKLAAERGVTVEQIALAWVLGQSFASIAIVAPSSPGEIVSLLPTFNIRLSAEECAWLNLESGDDN